MTKKQKYYVVWKGRQIGLFSNWKECSQQVTGFAGAEYKSFDSREAAEQAWQGNYEEYKGKPTATLSKEERRKIGSPTLDSYTIDASCSGYPGPVEYRCVQTRTREEVFRQGPYPQGANNIGEFLGLVHALMYFKQQGMTSPLYSDSQTAISWVQQKQCKTKLERSAQNEELFQLIERAEEWLQTNTYLNAILKWETAAWGENPADFGRK